MQIPGYQIIRKINQGGMSTVYLAIQQSVGREVALKVMSPALNADPVFSERFQREANIVGQLSHPNIVSIYDIGRYKSLNYIAMDYLPGGSVHDKMAIGITPSEALRIIKEIAAALDYAHEKGYIHRDIKTENILFREDNSAVLSDFGVAKTVSTASKMTNAGTVVGTPHYMSPEQARGKNTDGRADIYSLGVVLYEMLTGSVPYQADEAVAIAIKHLTAPIPKLPPQFGRYQGLINQMLAKDPEERFQRGQDIIDAIDAMDTTLPGSSSNSNYLSHTEPTAVQVYSLFKALLTTLYAAVALKLVLGINWLFGWRWKKNQGWHNNSKTTFFNTRIDTQVAAQDTLVAPRLQQEALSTKRHKPSRKIPRKLAALFVLFTTSSLVWWGYDFPFKNQIQSYVPQPINTWLTQVSHGAQGQIGLWGNELLSEETLSKTSEDSPFPSGSNTSTQPVKKVIATQKVAPLKKSPPKPVPTPKAPPEFALKVDTQPLSAKVQILNIKPRYYPGIQLIPGRYHVRVKATGYDTKEEWLEITNEPLTALINLRKTPVPGAVFTNELPKGRTGPEMVIVPPGKFLMGDKGASNTSPVRTVRIKQPFAVSRYEITYADFDLFTKATNRKAVADNGWGRGSRPVTNISWQDAKDYTRWLKKITGKKYRLLTEAEWEYTARSGKQAAFWWDGSASGNANCKKGCDSSFSGFFSAKTAPVGSYSSNRFGLYDTAGNIAEWTADCYQDHYLGAPKDGSAVEVNNCLKRSVRGGSFKNNTKGITNHARSAAGMNSTRNDLGFRVAVDLY